MNPVANATPRIPASCNSSIALDSAYPSQLHWTQRAGAGGSRPDGGWGHFNAGISQRIWVNEGTVEKHLRSILTKLNLAAKRLGAVGRRTDDADALALQQTAHGAGHSGD